MVRHDLVLQFAHLSNKRISARRFGVTLAISSFAAPLSERLLLSLYSKPNGPMAVILHLRIRRLRPVEVPRFARQNDYASGRVGLHLFAVELFAQADVENADMTV